MFQCLIPMEEVVLAESRCPLFAHCKEFQDFNSYTIDTHSWFTNLFLYTRSILQSVT